MAAIIASGALASGGAEPGAERVSVRKIWDAAPHNAFTDLIRFQGRWYCVFREGPVHASESIGAGRIIASADGIHWESVATLKADGDVRDPKLCLTPDGRLMATAGASLYRRQPGRSYPRGEPYQTLAWYSRNGTEWDGPAEIGDPGWWIWRITWREGAFYGIGKPADFASPRLYRGTEDARPAVWSENMFGAGSDRRGSEASLLFLADGRALCVMRGKDAAGGDDAKAMLGRSNPPYKEWEWQSLEFQIGGPHLAVMPDGRIVVAGRYYGKPRETRLWWLDPTSGRLDHFLTLSKDYDASYCGLVFHDGLLWVSYYAGTKQKAAIYLAKVNLPPPAN